MDIETITLRQIPKTRQTAEQISVGTTPDNGDGDINDPTNVARARYLARTEEMLWGCRKDNTVYPKITKTEKRSWRYKIFFCVEDYIVPYALKYLDGLLICDLE